MKINIITSPFGPLPPNALGAIERRWFYTAGEFAKQGHEVEFYAKQDASYENRENPKIIGIKGFLRSGNIYMDILKDLMYTFRAYVKMTQCDILVQN